MASLDLSAAFDAEIVETTFRSRFRFRFLKYPLSKKSRFFSGTRNLLLRVEANNMASN